MDIINLGPTLFNNYLLKFEKGCILVDAGSKVDYQTFLKKLEKVGISVDDIKFLFLTHVHNDHISYMKDLLENTNIIPIIHVPAEERLQEGKNRVGGSTGFLAKLMFLFFKAASKSEEPWEKIVLDNRKVYALDDTEYLRKQGFSLNIVALPGHTPDSIGLMTDEGLLFSGDMFVNGIPSVHRKTFLVEDLESYLASWEKVISLNPCTIFPSHGKSFPLKDVIKYIDKAKKIKIWKNS